MTVLLLLLAFALTAPAAGLDGKWAFTFQTEDGDREATIALQVNGEEVTGKVSDLEGSEIDVKGTFKGNAVRLEFPYYSDEAGVKAEVKIEGKLNGDSIQGDWQFESHSGEFSAKRMR
ncbi:MAG: hypothetical protein KIT09_32245 [Bryobacteraceae bacterium]|nr:hypothetical protein [Bryobacteraceae bacterium]